MTTDYPNDDDGDALRRIADDGNDMSRPMTIDFPVVLPDEPSARKFASLAAGRGYDVSVEQNVEEDAWDVLCTVEMVPTYDEVVRIQRELGEWAAPFGGHSDGWGTFGNREEEETEE